MRRMIFLPMLRRKRDGAGLVEDALKRKEQDDKKAERNPVKRRSGIAVGPDIPDSDSDMMDCLKAEKRMGRAKRGLKQFGQDCFFPPPFFFSLVLFRVRLFVLFSVV